MIHESKFAGPQVLRIGIAATGKLGVPFLNWRVSPRHLRDRAAQAVEHSGCGLYGVCFRGRLVYIGSYCGKKPPGIRKGAYFAGDIVKNRWWQHFGSLTARSHKLHVSPRVLANLRMDLGNHPLLVGLENAGAGIHADDGCLGAENRLRFAAQNWTRFSGQSESKLLRQFSFLYARDDGARLDGVSPLELQRIIDAAETEAISRMQPEVNTAKRGSKAAARRVSPQAALKVLAFILDSHLAPHRFESDGGESRRSPTDCQR